MVAAAVRCVMLLRASCRVPVMLTSSAPGTAAYRGSTAASGLSGSSAPCSPRMGTPTADRSARSSQPSGTGSYSAPRRSSGPASRARCVGHVVRLSSSFSKSAGSAPDAVAARDALIALHPIGHLGSPEDIGWGVVYLASDEAKFITGSELVIDGGYTAQ